LSNYWGKQRSSRPVKLQDLDYTGSGTLATTNLLPQTYQVRIVSDVRGYRGGDTEDNSEWFRTFDPKADRYQYGPDYVGKYNQVTESNAQLEGEDA
jgi:hypothetical protein